MTGELYEGLKVIDVDAHWSEPHDLWTSRAPAKYADRVPQVKELNGKRMWYIQVARRSLVGSSCWTSWVCSLRCSTRTSPASGIRTS